MGRRQQINTRKIVSRLHHSLSLSILLMCSLSLSLSLVSQFLFVSYVRRLTLKSILIGFLFKKRTFFLHHHHTIIIRTHNLREFNWIYSTLSFFLLYHAGIV